MATLQPICPKFDPGVRFLAFMRIFPAVVIMHWLKRWLHSGSAQLEGHPAEHSAIGLLGVANIIESRLVMAYFLRPFSAAGERMCTAYSYPTTLLLAI